eukprot:SM000005S17298  [mRNA]  locus=s5:1360614:1363366:+ [translate_table: standard]
MVPQAAACLAVLMGLPAAGKTTLARALAALAAASPDGVRTPATARKVAVVHFDDFRCGGSSCGGGGLLKDWREARHEALHQVELLLQHQDAEGAPLLIIVDDTMELRSVRLRAYKLARRYISAGELTCAVIATVPTDGAAFIVVYIAAPPALSQARNESRPAQQRVPESVLAQMTARLEPPDGTMHSSELSAVIVNATGSSQDLSQHVWEELLQRWGEPAPALTSHDDYATLNDHRSANSALHLLDLRTRKLQSASLSALQARGDTGHILKAAQQLSGARRELLCKARAFATSCHSETSGRLDVDHEARSSAGLLVEYVEAEVARYEARCFQALDNP